MVAMLTNASTIDRPVYVVGAGAGTSIGMPLGSDLITDIRNIVNIEWGDNRRGLTGDPLLAMAIEKRIRETQKVKSADDYLITCKTMRDGLLFAESIDNFINLHEGDEKLEFIAKLAIARIILARERSCKIFIRQKNRESHFDREVMAKTWYTKYLHLLCRGVQFDGVVDRLGRTQFIIFNYDRCLETFLYEALQIKCRESAESVADALNNSTFIHPYGQIGLLPWQSGSNWVQFGDEKIGDRLTELSESIRTFHEQQSDDSAVESIHDAIRNANKIAFLGFAYHKMNMSLLYPDDKLQTANTMGTVYEMEADNVELVIQSIWSTLHRDIRHSFEVKQIVKMINADCDGFMNNFDRRLSYSD